MRNLIIISVKKRTEWREIMLTKELLHTALCLLSKELSQSDISRDHLETIANLLAQADFAIELDLCA
jgi:hypothetical protein